MNPVVIIIYSVDDQVVDSTVDNSITVFDKSCTTSTTYSGGTTTQIANWF